MLHFKQQTYFILNDKSTTKLFSWLHVENHNKETAKKN